MPWFCVYCGAERDLADFGKERCSCGAHALSSRPEVAAKPVDEEYDRTDVGVTVRRAVVAAPLPYPATVKSNEWNLG